MTETTSSETHDVVVVGSGPAGMMLAAELALAGVDTVVLERRPTAALAGSRAGGFHARTIEVLDQRGIADRFLAEGTTVQVHQVAGTLLDISGFASRHPYTLGLWQQHIERILLGRVEEFGVPIRRGVEVTGHAQQATGDAYGVTVHVADAEPLRARYLVGADGGRSVVRRAAGIGFVGPDATRSSLIAEVEVTEPIPDGVRHDEIGVHGLAFLEDGRTVRAVVTEREVGPSTEPTLADLREALRIVFGTDFGVHDPTWISRFSDATRQAETYRDGRVLLVGDAAHVHSPTGGQGIGLGIQDAVNLGFKLAQVVHGVSPDALLDTYDSERRAAGARVLRRTMALTLTQRDDPRTAALNELLDGVLALDAPRDLVAGELSGLTTRYDLGEGHPLLGLRMPDLDLTGADGASRVYELLHDARPLLLDLGAGVSLGAWSGRVRRVATSYDGAWELPVIGAVSAPGAVLVRPDGHVAWAGDGGQAGLEAALARWCGSTT